MLTNPLLKYYGGKFRLAKWIIGHFPEHEHYLEPFGGGGSILFQKPISRIETYNDRDGDVCNFFRVLRERPDELVRSIRLTPWARDEFEECLTTFGASLRGSYGSRLSQVQIDVENARRLYARLWMSRQSGTLASASSWRRNKEKRSPASDIRPQVIYDAAARLAKVQIENRDALQLIAEMDTPKTLVYVDPPYVTETRSDKKRYAHEMSDQDHRSLAGVIKSIKAFVVLSGYRCGLYSELYEDAGWRRIDTIALANGGVKKTESLWLSPRTAAVIS